MAMCLCRFVYKCAGVRSGLKVLSVMSVVTSSNFRMEFCCEFLIRTDSALTFNDFCKSSVARPPCCCRTACMTQHMTISLPTESHRYRVILGPYVRGGVICPSSYLAFESFGDSCSEWLGAPRYFCARSCAFCASAAVDAALRNKLPCLPGCTARLRVPMA